MTSSWVMRTAVQGSMSRKTGQASCPVFPISPRKRAGCLRVKIEVEFVRMRPQADLVDLLPLEFHPHVDDVFGEHAALEQELVVALERVERLIERPGHLLR